MLRVFIKSWIFIFIIIIFDFIIALRTSIGFFYFFFWFLTSFVIISLVWLFVEYFGIRLNIDRKIAAKIEEDDFLEAETVINNNGFLPIVNFVLEDHFPCAIYQERKKRVVIERLGAKSHLSLRYRCLCPQRGKYKIGPFSIYLFDPWGLFFLKKTYPVYSEIYIYPKIFNILKFPPLLKGTAPWFGIETNRVSGDEHEFFGVREYKPGDPIKRIHWLSTARKNRLIVKEFQKQTFFSATIIFNLDKDRNYGEGKNSVAEYAIKIAASVAKYLIDRNISLEVIAHVGEIVHIPFNKGPDHLEDILRFLSIARAESNITLGELFHEFSRYIPNDSTLIVILLDKDWEYLSAILALEKKNVSLIPLTLISSSFLYPSAKDSIVKDIQTKLPQTLKLNPLFFSRGDSLEEPFISIKA